MKKKYFKKAFILLLLFESIFIFINFNTLVEKMSFDLCDEKCFARIDEENTTYLKEIHQDSIVINKLGVKAPVLFNSGSLESEIIANLESGVVFYPGSNLPSENGVVVLLGHSSNYWWDKSLYNNVFTLLPELKIGDEIRIFYQNKEYNYRVNGNKILDTNKWSQLLSDSTKKSLSIKEGLILVTCWPVGTSWKRFAVYAEKVN